MEELQPQDIEDLLQELEEEEAETEVRAEEASSPPSDGAAQHLERAFALEDEDEYEKALGECDATIRLDPTLADAHNLRGVILEELGRVGEAVLAYREAQLLDPGFSAACENLQAAEAELDEYRIGPRARRPRCRGLIDVLRRCPEQAAFRCRECGDALCPTHARIFRSSSAAPAGDGNSGAYCAFHYRAVVERENLRAIEAELQAERARRTRAMADRATGLEDTMEWVEELVLFEVEDQTGHYTWQLASVDLDPVAGAITLRGTSDREPKFIISVNEIASCGIVQRKEVKRDLHRALEGSQGDWGVVFILPILLLVDHMLVGGTKVPVLKLTQSSTDEPGQGRVIHLRSRRRGSPGKEETLGLARRFVTFFRQAGHDAAILGELKVLADLEPAVGEVHVPADFETPPQPQDWRFWFDFVGAGLLGGLTLGGLGGFAAGFLPMLGLSGALGGAVGGGVAAGIHWLGLRGYVSLTRGWVLVCCVVGAATWAIASGWAAADLGSMDPVSFERDRVHVFVVAGIMAGAIGGAVSGMMQVRILRQRIANVANWWLPVNTLGWAAGGAIFLPTFYAWAIGLIGGGNPGASAAADIRVNAAICQPVCLTLLVLVPVWVLVQVARGRMQQ